MHIDAHMNTVACVKLIMTLQKINVRKTTDMIDSSEPNEKHGGRAYPQAT